MISMNRISVFVLTTLAATLVVVKAHAQSPETIWLSANVTSYKTGETVIATVNAFSATPIQGFTFQIRYDPACLRPVNASSPIPAMNGLQLPQLIGLVDGSYASTTPQFANGILAEVRFTALKGCQTSLTLESAALAVRSPEGFAASLPGVFVGERNVSYSIDGEAGVAQPSQPETGSILALDPPEVDQGIPSWIFVVLFAIVIGVLMFGAYKVFRIGSAN
jgi:hypothetical protein